MSKFVQTAEKPRILAVDDNSTNLEYIVAAVVDMDVEVVLASNGEEALTHLAEKEFAAILLDVRMPKMDGFEVAKIIRSQEQSKHTPILFMTAYQGDGPLLESYLLGAVDFLLKPVVPVVLRAKVAVFMELARQNRLLKKQAEMLARSELRFRSLLEAAPDAMVVTRECGEIVFANTQAVLLFGFTAHELIGKDINDLITNFPLAVFVHSSFATALFRQALRGTSKSGRDFPAEISVSRLPTGDEGPLIISAIRDVTEQSKTAELLRELTTR